LLRKGKGSELALITKIKQHSPIRQNQLKRRGDAKTTQPDNVLHTYFSELHQRSSDAV